MKNPFPTSRELKLVTKDMMRKTMPVWIRITLLLVVLQVGCYFLRLELGGVLSYFPVSLEEYPTAATGYFPMEGGFSVIVRLDLLGFAVAIPLTFRQIVTFLVVNLVTFVLLAPLTMAVQERYWAAWSGKTEPPRPILQWYVNPALAAKAVVVQLLIGLGSRLLGFLVMAPGSYLYFRIYGGDFGPLSPQVGYLALLAMAMMLIGALLAFFFSSVLLPIQYCLAACPQYPVGQAVRQGLGITKGRRWGFCRFRLSFLGWFILSQFTYGALNFYVLPYTSLCAMRFVQEQAWSRQRQEHPPEQE